MNNSAASYEELLHTEHCVTNTVWMVPSMKTVLLVHLTYLRLRSTDLLRAIEYEATRFVHRTTLAVVVYLTHPHSKTNGKSMPLGTVHPRKVSVSLCNQLNH